MDVQNISTLNLHASRSIAVRVMQSHGGPADYILFVDGKALGIVEAKKEGITLSAVAEQSARVTSRRNRRVLSLPNCEKWQSETDQMAVHQ